ncbi:AlpA family phage regulatory protein [Sphingomonas sp. UYEF23]|uniref:helix-turn-helix transcriptional regulator n=1 Tax=Sphingomonas sp. UYEF23 TaxID=1756408 RepID=UPI003390D050
MDAAFIIRTPEVLRRTGISRSQLYALMARGHFPRAVKLSVRMVGWNRDAVEQWILSRPEVVYQKGKF